MHRHDVHRGRTVAAASASPGVAERARTRHAARAPRPGDGGDGFPPISDYAIIGDCRTVALISRAGSIEWLCLPRFDSPSVFGAILDRRRGGAFAVRPVRDAAVSRRYVGETNVLETTFTTDTGVLVVTDLFAVSEPDHHRHLWPDHEILRRVECTEGRVDVAVDITPRPNYGRTAAHITDRGRLGHFASHRTMTLAFRSEMPLALDASGEAIRGGETLKRGDRRFVSLSYTDMLPQIVMPLGDEAEARVRSTLAWWQHWAGRCTHTGPHRPQVVRSALALKLLTYAPSGAIIAAPTTSLPEHIGGVRNWDYRYCWLRDASMTYHALLNIGYREEGRSFLSWLLHATRITRPELHIFYDVHGDPHVPERELGYLDGYRGSQPVRIGNAAEHQLQLDVYGAVTDAAYDFVQRGGHLGRSAQKLLGGFGEVVCRLWKSDDAGIWEVRGEPAPHTLSKAMCWVTLDRLLKLHEQGRLDDLPVERLRTCRDEIRRVVESRGYHAGNGSYMGVLDSDDDYDASVLLLSLYDYHAPDHPRMLSTYDAVHRKLGRDGLILRYDPHTRRDPYDESEGAFALCGFWYADCLARAGRVDEAWRVFEHLASFANDVGLYGEEISFETGAPLGNFPQAYTHVGLINAAFAIEAARGEAETAAGQTVE